MLGKKSGQTKKQQFNPVAFPNLARPRYDHPKILFINMKDETETVLNVEGYDVASQVILKRGVPHGVCCVPR